MPAGWSSPSGTVMKSGSTRSDDFPRIVVPKRHGDGRGWFSESFHKDRLRGVGIACDFVQDNQSSSTNAGTLRGLHFQLPPAGQAKLVQVLKGSVLDVIVDVRNGSPTYGKHVSATLSAANSYQVYVPIGFAHGFITLEPDVLIMYKVSHFYEAALDSGIRWNDPDIDVPWPIKESNITLSEKDRRLPLLKEFSSPFPYDGTPLGPLQMVNLG